MSMMVSPEADLAGTHTLMATSDGAGQLYQVATSPTIKQYTVGSWWIFYPDATNVAGAKVDIDGIGPLPLFKSVGVPVTGGECAKGDSCILVSIGNPVSGLRVH